MSSIIPENNGKSNFPASLLVPDALLKGLEPGLHEIEGKEVEVFDCDNRPPAGIYVPDDLSSLSDDVLSAAEKHLSQKTLIMPEYEPIKAISAIAAERKRRAPAPVLPKKEPLSSIINSTPPKPEKAPEEKKPKVTKASVAGQLVEIVESLEVPLHHYQGDGYARISKDGKPLTMALRSGTFKKWLSGTFYKLTRKIPSSSAIKDALNILESLAIEGEELPVFFRVAPGEEKDHFYIDLADTTGRAIHVYPGGWEVVPSPPCLFRLNNAALPLQEPQRGGNIDLLKKYLTIDYTSKNDFILFIAWLAQAFKPNGPYPINVLLGEHGSGKSTTMSYTGKLLDPTAADRQSLPRDEQALQVTATISHLLRIDNISSLSGWFSDALCRMATGGGAVYRKLYTDQDASVFTAMRPLIVNGISDFIHRPDLLDRSIIFYCPNITTRRTERQMKADFEKDAPLILGGMLDLISAALDVKIDESEELPRMADFAEFGMKLEVAAGWEKGAFLNAYNENLRSAKNLILESDPLALEIKKFINAQMGVWSGTASELLSALALQAGVEATRKKWWPERPSSLGSAVRRLAPVLRNGGIDVDFDRTGDSREIHLALDIPF